MNKLTTISNERIDQLEKVMYDNFPKGFYPLNHSFLDGVYIRTIFMPKGSLITSMRHRTRHPFTVVEGVVSVWVNEGQEQLLIAPYEGITEPNTRRVLYIHEDCIWVTYHLNPDNQTVDEIEERIIEKRENPLLNNKIDSPLIEMI